MTKSYYYDSVTLQTSRREKQKIINFYFLFSDGNLCK